MRDGSTTKTAIAVPTAAPAAPAAPPLLSSELDGIPQLPVHPPDVFRRPANPRCFRCASNKTTTGRQQHRDTHSSTSTQHGSRQRARTAAAKTHTQQTAHRDTQGRETHAETHRQRHTGRETHAERHMQRHTCRDTHAETHRQRHTGREDTTT